MVGTMGALTAAGAKATVQGMCFSFILLLNGIEGQEGSDCEGGV